MRTNFEQNQNQRSVEGRLHNPNASKVTMKVNVTQAASILTVLVIRKMHTAQHN